jgi:hypothetical protein
LRLALNLRYASLKHLCNISLVLAPCDPDCVWSRACCYRIGVVRHALRLCPGLNDRSEARCAPADLS